MCIQMYKVAYDESTESGRRKHRKRMTKAQKADDESTDRFYKHLITKEKNGAKIPYTIYTIYTIYYTTPLL